MLRSEVEVTIIVLVSLVVSAFIVMMQWVIQNVYFWSTPEVANNKIYVSGIDGNVYSISYPD